jgi:hypothetical protein
MPAAPSMAQRQCCSSECTILQARDRENSRREVEQTSAVHGVPGEQTALQLSPKSGCLTNWGDGHLLPPYMPSITAHHFMDSSSLAARYRGSKP